MVRWKLAFRVQGLVLVMDIYCGALGPRTSSLSGSGVLGSFNIGYSHPSESGGIGSRLPTDTNTLGCSSPLYKIMLPLHRTNAAFLHTLNPLWMMDNN